MLHQIAIKSRPIDRYGAYLWDLPESDFPPFSKVVTFRSVMILISWMNMSILRSCTICKQEIIILLYLMKNFINLKFTYLYLLPTNFWLFVLLMSYSKYSYMLFWRHAFYRQQATWKHLMYIKIISPISIKRMKGKMERWKDGWMDH